MLSQSSTNKTEKHVFQTMNMIMMHNHVVSYTMGVRISPHRIFRSVVTRMAAETKASALPGDT